jgi:hypothetical protein
MIGARLHGETWHAGEPTAPLVIDGAPLADHRLDAAFDLSSEAPLRLFLGDDRRTLAVAAHHAAFDGLSLVALIAALLGGPMPTPVGSPPPGPAESKAGFARRLLRPADRIAPSPHPPERDSYASTEIRLSGPNVTARLAAACVESAAAHNSRRGAPWRRVGISLATGGPPGVGNVASYRRVDLTAGTPVVPPVLAALASPDEPPEQAHAGLALALARPLIRRFSDSLLVSNLGRQAVPSAEQLQFFPVARGRSAVAFGAATVEGGKSALSVRARDLTVDDAKALLEGVVVAVERDAGLIRAETDGTSKLSRQPVVPPK